MQTIAGAVSTSTHGTGARRRRSRTRSRRSSWSRPTAPTRRIAADADPELLRAARVSLGTLGVITKLTLRCEPAFTLERTDVVRPLDEALARFDELTEANDHFEFFIFPHTELALCRDTKRIDGPPQPWSKAKAWWEEEFVENHAMKLVSRICRRFPVAHPRRSTAASRRCWATA